MTFTLSKQQDNNTIPDSVVGVDVAFRNKCMIPFILLCWGFSFFKIVAIFSTVFSLLKPVFRDLNFFSKSLVVMGFRVKYRRTASSVIPCWSSSLVGVLVREEVISSCLKICHPGLQGDVYHARNEQGCKVNVDLSHHVFSNHGA